MKFFPGDVAHRLALVGFHAQQDMDRNVIVLDFDMELFGDTLKAAPDFIRRIHAIIVHEECGVRKVSSKTEVMGVDFEIFRLDPDDKVLRNDGAIVVTLEKTVLRKLAVSRPNKPILLEREVKLHFSLAYDWEPAIWKWAQNFFSLGFWCKFSGSQIELRSAKDEEPAQGVLDAVANLASTVDGKGITKLSIKRGDETLVEIDKAAADRIQRAAGRTPKKKGKKA